MRRAMLALVLLVFVPGVGSAQQPEDQWGELKNLRAGQKVRVVDTTFQKTEGRLVEVSEDYLKFKANGKEVTLERDQVTMVSLRSGLSTGKKILLGILGGALMGLSAWAKVNRCEKYGCWDETTGWYEGSGKGLSRRSAAIATSVGAGAGGIFAAFTGKSDQLIYVHNPTAPYYEAPLETNLEPQQAGEPEGGNVFDPVVAPAPAEPTPGDSK